MYCTVLYSYKYTKKLPGMHARARGNKGKKKEGSKMSQWGMVNREKGNLVVSFIYSLWRGLLASQLLGGKCSLARVNALWRCLLSWHHIVFVTSTSFLESGWHACNSSSFLQKKPRHYEYLGYCAFTSISFPAVPSKRSPLI